MFIRVGRPRTRRPMVVAGGAPIGRRRRSWLGFIPLLIVLGIVLFLIWRIMARQNGL